MGRLGFVLDRFGAGTGLNAYSVSRDNLLGDLNARHVAIVGNARSLSTGQSGAAIDSADVVIRMNRAPIPDVASHGSRCDWLGLATSLGQSDRDRLKPGRILWMSHKRKRLSYRDATSPGFYLHPRSNWQELKQNFGAPPTTGLMLIDLVAVSDAKSITLYGFDFFQSLSLSGRRTGDQVPHDFAAEKRYVDDLLASDPRVKLVLPAT